MLSLTALAQGLPMAKPEAVGMNAAKLDRIEQIVLADMAEKKLPGAVVIVGRKGQIVYRKAFGNRSLVPTVEPMTVDTIFDVASLTKPVATATSIMILVEEGKLRLSDTVGKFIPDIEDDALKRITIQQLLTHTSGLRPSFDLSQKWEGRDGMLAALKKEKLRNPAGTRFVYSDVGFMVLGEIISRAGPEFKSAVSERDFLNFPRLNIFLLSGMDRTAFITLIETTEPPFFKSNFSSFGTVDKLFSASIAPTENVRGQNSYLGAKFEGDNTLGDQIFRGSVHDPTAYRMGGVAGHAGLFSTADDLARYAQMILNGGVAPGDVRSNADGASRMLAAPVRVLSAQTIARMTQPYVVSEDGATRGLGWDMNTTFSSNRGELFPLGSFGHTGFTGTSIWIDPTSETFVVFMSNRVHPDGKGDVVDTRARVATIAASAIEDMPVERWREAEAQYNAAVAAQVPKFRHGVEAARQISMTQIANLPINGRTVIPESQYGFRPGVAPPAVANGIDVLQRDDFKELAGKRVGLVTNHTGRNLAGKSTIDILHEAKNIKLVSIFAPEHGIRGELDTEKIDDAKDEKTGLPVYSLYKDGMRRPKPEQLAGLDAIVYDIQDIGARFYTYTATLKNVMEEATEAKIPVYVLDRPNPINGTSVEGALAEEAKLTFIAAHTIPVRYGMTIGELGMMMNAERKIGADVRVIKMENWRRGMWFDETGQTWVNPSPNMRSLTQATLYPGIGLLETTNVSVGRGTDTPFEVVGAPWMDGQRVAKYLNERSLPGIRFVPIQFKPNASVYKDEELGGVNFVITDRRVFEPLRTGIEIAVALRALYPNEWQAERYGRLLVNSEILEMVMRGEKPEAIMQKFRTASSAFETRRRPFLLYQ